MDIVIADSIDGEGFLAFLRRELQELAAYCDARNTPKNIVNDVVKGLLGVLRELIERMGFERAERTDGSATTTGDGGTVFMVSIDSKACAAAFEAAKRDIDCFHDHSPVAVI